MKTLYMALTGICLAGAVAAFGAVLWMIKVAMGATLASVALEVWGSGNLNITGVAAAIGLAAAAIGLLVHHRMAGKGAMIALWVASLAGIGAAKFQTIVLFLRIAKVSKNMGGLEFSVRAPGYADALLILTVGLGVGAAGFAALMWLKTHSLNDLGSVQPG